MAGNHGRGGKVRRRDHRIAAREPGLPICTQAGSRRNVRQRGDEQDRGVRCRHVGDPRSASALRVHDVDPFGGDQALQTPGASPELERIDRCIHEGNPFAAGSRELRNERAVLGCHERARADFSQRRGYIKRSARGRLLAQCGHNLQDGRAGQGARMLPLVVAHGVYFLRSAAACLPSGHACIQWPHGPKHAPRPLRS